MQKDVIVVTDMLDGFYGMGNLANPRLSSIIPRIRDLLEKKSRREGCLTFFLQDSHKRNDPEFQIFPEHCVKGTQETEIIGDLKEFSFLPNSHIIPKTKYSGCYGTWLGKKLEFENPSRVIVMGVCTDLCVLYTVADLSRNRGHNVFVLADCVETFDAPPDHQADQVNAYFLNHMEKYLGAKVVRSQEI